MKRVYSVKQGVIRGSQGAVLAVLGCGALSSPAMAATPGVAAVPAQQCLSDVGSFVASMGKQGYWIDGGGYGDGYPIYGYGYGYGGHVGESAHYGRARPGYEVRTLLATSRILAQRGDQPGCEAILSTARDAYATYASELRKGQVPAADVPTWRQQQIETAVPVSTEGIIYRADQLIGATIVNGKNEGLGTVEDMVISPQTGKIAYLVVSHGGLWGIDEKYSPVPWGDFKSATGNNLLVLTVTKAALDASPQVEKNEMNGQAEFAAQSHKVDSYWAAHPPVAMN